MAYTIIASTAAGSGGGSTVTTSAIDTTGADTLILVRSDTGTNRAAISDSKGNTWNALTVSQQSTAAACTIFWAHPTLATVGTGHTFTATQASSFPAISVIAVAGGAMSPADQQNGTPFLTSTSTATGSVTPSADNELIVTGFCSGNNATSLAINSGFTIRATAAFGANNVVSSIATLIQNSAAAVNPTWSWTGSSAGAVRIATFLPVLNVGNPSEALTMAGDYLAYKKNYSGWEANATITSADQTTTTAQAAKSANHQIFVQKITLSITTHANGKVALTVQSSNASPVPIASHTDLTAGAGVPETLVWDFGPAGIPIAKGENVNWLWSTGGSGPTGVAHMEGYQKLIGPVAPASTN